jgi:hypothetical protein
MRVKINKVIPVKEANQNNKAEVFFVGNEKYTLSTYKMDERNFTGYPFHLQFISSLPDANVDYDYAKFNVRIFRNRLDCSRKLGL